MTAPFDAAWRTEALARLEGLRHVAREYLEGWEEAEAEHDRLLDEYMARVPRPVVCSDPFTGDPVRIGIDTFGLDGPWWRLDGPARPLDEPLHRNLYAFHGAMRLTEPYEVFGHTTWPGPVAPYVVPRLLLRPGVLAVVAALAVGRHQGWITAYFAEPPQPEGRRACEWGRSEYRYRRGEPDGPLASDEAYIYPVEWDHDLRSWMESGLLAWAPPEEPDAPFRVGPDGCPFLDLKRPDDPSGLGVLAYGKLAYQDYDEAAAGQTNPNEL